VGIRSQVVPGHELKLPTYTLRRNILNRDDKKNITSLVKSIYHPSIVERKIKARFWSIWLEGPSKGEATIEAAADLLGEPSLLRKADDPAFLVWFLNRFEDVEKLRYLAQMGLDVVEDILVSSEAKVADKLKAVALVNDLVKASAPKTEVVFADADLNTMDDEQLEALIKRLR
jgi:hypothetical protein